MYSQKPLLTLLKAGKFPGESGVPDHIETVISNVFIFKDRVYKVYKNDSEFFNRNFQDFSGREDRHAFTTRDFTWNNALSPSIYTKTVGVRVEDGQITLNDEAPEELIIAMNRANTRDLLFERLLSDDLTEEDCYHLGKQLAEQLTPLQQSMPVEDYAEFFTRRISDVRLYIQPVAAHVPSEEANRYLDFLEKVTAREREWFNQTLGKEVTTDGDFHSQNAVYTGGSLYLMDTFAPKEEWGQGHRLIALYRLGADIYALSGKKEYFEAFLKGYEDGSGVRIDRKLDDVYIVYALSIAVSFLYMLSQTDSSKGAAALRLHTFLRRYFEEKNLDQY